jgi:hypothetical protein
MFMVRVLSRILGGRGLGGRGLGGRGEGRLKNCTVILGSASVRTSYTNRLKHLGGSWIVLGGGPPQHTHTHTR